MDLKEKYRKTLSALDKVSPSFCMAKWNHVTLHLHSGENHSCHHPRRHDIQNHGLNDHPELLHNTGPKIKAREQMIQGQRPTECQFCWTVEDSGGNQISDRVVKSSAWSTDADIAEILKNPTGSQFYPKYVEVGFSNVCNLKCVYCGPQFSSSWMSEIKQFGNNIGWVASEKDHLAYGKPFVEAFLKWWPELKLKLKVLRLTGGEPLLSEDVFKMLEDIRDGVTLDLELVINSNLFVPEKRIEDMLYLLKQIVDAKKIKKIKLVTSMESVGRQAEYIRSGINVEIFWKNLEKILRANVCEVSITATINILVIGTFFEFYKVFSQLKDITRGVHKHQFFVDPNLLKEPEHLNIFNFPSSA